MNARSQVAGLLDRWLDLTRRESQAIEKAAWNELAAIQAAKASLRQPLRQTFDEWIRLYPATDTPGESGHAFRAAIDRLLAMETRNAELLEIRRQGALERKRLLDQASRNLRMLGKSYAQKPATAWQSYS